MRVLVVLLIFQIPLFAQGNLELLRQLEVLKGINENSSFYIPISGGVNLKRLEINDLRGGEVFTWKFDSVNQKINFKKSNDNIKITCFYDSSNFYQIHVSEDISRKVKSESNIQLNGGNSIEFLYGKNFIFQKWIKKDSIVFSDSLLFLNSIDSSKTTFNWLGCENIDFYESGFLAKREIHCLKGIGFSSLHKVYDSQSSKESFNYSYSRNEIGQIEKAINSLGDKFYFSYVNGKLSSISTEVGENKIEVIFKFKWRE